MQARIILWIRVAPLSRQKNTFFEVKCRWIVVKRALFWKKDFQIYQKITSDWGGFDLRLLFCNIQLPFYQKRYPFIEVKSPFPGNNIIQFFCCKKIISWYFIYFIWNVFITYFAYLFYYLWHIIRYMLWNKNVDRARKEDR